MMEERLDSRAPIDEYVARLKSVIPVAEHGALESRLDELLNDPSADADDIISILGEEFDPQHQQ
jgi:hypothetical protein